jgi:hypothetical protein
MLINLPYNVDLPARRSIFGVSCSSRTAKRSLAQYARLLSVGVKWLAIVLRLAMALDHLRIAPAVVQLAFGILFGGIDRIRLGARSWAWLEGICHQIARTRREKGFQRHGRRPAASFIGHQSKLDKRRELRLP